MSIYKNKHSVFIGDCYGTDAAVQEFFMKLNYPDVTVFASNGRVRNNIGNWTVRNIPADSSVKGFDFYKQKDEAMANCADYGFMIWDGKSRGTLNNIINLISQNKKVLVYMTAFHKMLTLGTLTQLNSLIEICPEEMVKIYKQLLRKNNAYASMQVSFFA